MAIVHCRSCKTKITQRDTTCPKCGSPNSRLAQFIVAIVLSFAGFVFFTVYKEVVRNNDNSVTVENSSADPEEQPAIMRTGMADE